MVFSSGPFSLGSTGPRSAFIGSRLVLLLIIEIVRIIITHYWLIMGLAGL